MNMQEIANEVMKFIQNEVERLSTGGSKAGGGNNSNMAQPDFSDIFQELESTSSPTALELRQFPSLQSGLHRFYVIIII